MIILYGTIFVFYAALMLAASRRSPLPGRKGEKWGIWDKTAYYIYGMGKKRKLFHQGKMEERLQILYPGTGGKKGQENAETRSYYIGKIRLLLLLIFAGNGMALCLFVGGRAGGILEDGQYIRRNAFGEGRRELDLQVRTEEENTWQEVRVMVEEQAYEKEQVKEMAEEIKALLPGAIKGDNVSLEEVRGDLTLVRKLEGYPFQIRWESDNYLLLYSDGTVENEKVKEEGEIVTLTAALTYGGFREEYIFPVCIYPPQYPEQELWEKKLYELLMDSEEKGREEEKMKLPDQMDGKGLIWKEKWEDNSGYLFLLACLGAGAVYLLQDEKLKEKVERRNRQMFLDYPQVISKLMLYMGAGMTIRNAFQKIAGNYSKEKQGTECRRYVYEEMLLACRELDSGIPEAAVYERFGKRCRLPQYTKLANILVQNLRKGSNGILDALRQEAQIAFEERKNMARKLGEEAGTKLLIPMMLMLGIVMVLIIIPAYFSFSV